MSDLDTEDGDDFSVSTPELAACARINFEQIMKLNPALQSHPIYFLALQQLKAVVARLEKAEA